MDGSSRSWTLAAMATTFPSESSRLLVAAEAMVVHLDDGARWLALRAIAYARPPNDVLQRLLAASDDLDSTSRMVVLEAVATANPGSKILARVEAAAIDLEPDQRTRVLLAAADANLSDRRRLLAAAESAAAAGLSPSGRAKLLVAAAESDPSAELLALIDTAATSLPQEAPDPGADRHRQR